MFTPFEALHGFTPITPPALILPHNVTPTNWIERVNDILEQLKAYKILQSHYANRTRIDKQFNVGDKIMLDTMNLYIRNQPTYKFK